MFRLLRYFSYSSAVVILAVIVALVALYRDAAEKGIVRVTETQSTVLAHSLVNKLWPSYAEFVERASRHEPRGLLDLPETMALDESLREQVEGLPVTKIKIYNLDMVTIFSSDHREIGLEQSHNPELLRAASNGQPISKLMQDERLVSFDGSERDMDVVETYLPVFGEDGQVRAIFEVYADVTPYMESIRATMLILLAGLLAALGLLQAGLYLIVRHADRVLHGQYADLEQEIARRKRVEGDLRTATEAATEAGRAKSSFLANMSHELRTPLNAVIGFAEVIAEQAFGEVSPPRYRDYAADIRRAGRRLLLLVDNVLDLAKIEAGKMEVACEHFDLRDLLEDVTRAQRSAVGQNGNRLELVYVRAYRQMVSDEAKIRSIVTNVLERMGEDIEGGTIEVHVCDSRDFVQICVTAMPAAGADGRSRSPAPARGNAVVAMVGGQAAGSSPGLAVAQRFCETLEGRLEVRDGRDGEIRVSISLPDLACQAAVLPLAALSPG